MRHGPGMRRLLVLLAACSTPTHATPRAWCTPRDACWPSAGDWHALAASLTGTLVEPTRPAPSTDPFTIEDQPGGTQSLGWLDAWSATPSRYAIAAANASDIAKGVAFARDHHLRLVVKGTGHDYLGRSSAPDSLLIWTHALRDITVDDAFVPSGCSVAPTQAVTVGAGTRWLEAYQQVTGVHHRYVQGGGCTSVGAAGGFLQGGGFGSLSKKFGIAAASLLEAEVVTASGAIITANACQHADLYWALRGGGGGTFGVVTKVTLRTHELPALVGGAFGTIKAPSEAAFREVTEQLVALYRAQLANEHWGEQLRWRPDNSIDVAMVFEGLTTEQANAAWEPLRAWGAAHGVTVAVQAFAFPGDKLWDFDFLTKVGVKLGGTPARWWWGDNQGEVATYWAAYQSRWLPLALFDHPKELAATLVAASRHWSVGLHFNKGQAAAAPDAIARDRETAMNPAVLDAAALVIVAADDAGYATDRARAEADRAKVAAAMAEIRAATPGAGSYINETDYFEPDWQRAFWGDNYSRLLAIKHAYDPDGLFVCHHCVGSEATGAAR